MSKSSWQHLYGPVPSRRLGRSLGVDLVPYKTCSFDCIYCQLGRTTNKTVERQPYVDPAAILDELGQWLEQDGQADYITFSGLGEPTLNSVAGPDGEGCWGNDRYPDSDSHQWIAPMAA